MKRTLRPVVVCSIQRIMQCNMRHGFGLGPFVVGLLWLHDVMRPFCGSRGGAPLGVHIVCCISSCAAHRRPRTLWQHAARRHAAMQQ